MDNRFLLALFSETVKCVSGCIKDNSPLVYECLSTLFHDNFALLGMFSFPYILGIPLADNKCFDNFCVNVIR